MLRLLFLAANPADRQELGLHDEYRNIFDEWQASQFKDEIDCRDWPHTTANDLHNLLRAFKPHILHFSGHGSKLRNLVLEDSIGLSKDVNREPLAHVLEILGKDLKFVFLNACYSDEQAAAIAENVKCTIGSSNKVQDSNAIIFSKEFYKEIFNKASIKKGFETAASKLEITGKNEISNLEIKPMEGENPDNLVPLEETINEESFDIVLKEYLDKSYRKDEYTQLDQAGDQNTPPPKLPSIFIDLDLVPGSIQEKSVWTETTYLSALHELLEGDKKRVVIIGGPGYGKSTLGQFLCQKHRAYYLDKQNELEDKYKLKTPRIPFRIVLRFYAQYIADHTQNYTIETFLTNEVRLRTNIDALDGGFIEKVLKTHPILLVLDGLDEVMDNRIRNEMMREIRQFIEACETRYKSNIQIVATSRPSGYSNEFNKFNQYGIAPITEAKILEYTEKWIKVNNLDEHRSKLVREGIRRNMNHPLLQSPLQLTILILIIQGSGEVPTQREAFFEEYLEVIYKREVIRKTESFIFVNIQKELLFRIHRYIGFLLHRDAERSQAVESLMPEEVFRREISKFLKKKFMDSMEIDRITNQFITESRDRLVLLVEPRTGYFGFEIRSFQEFFAAQYLAQTAEDSHQKIARFRTISLSPHWENVTLFFAGWINNHEDGLIDRIVNVCKIVDQEEIDIYLKRGTSLALSLAVDHCFSFSGIGINISFYQKNLLEYALSILESEISATEENNLFTNLKLNLQKEELEVAVMPPLLQKIQRMILPDDIRILDCLASISNDRSRLEEIIVNEMSKNKQNASLLLQRSLKFGLSHEFILRTFSDTKEISHDKFGEYLIDFIYDASIDETDSPKVTIVKGLFLKLVDEVFINPSKFYWDYNMISDWDAVYTVSYDKIFDILNPKKLSSIEKMTESDQKIHALRCIFNSVYVRWSNREIVVNPNLELSLFMLDKNEIIPQLKAACLFLVANSIKFLPLEQLIAFRNHIKLQQNNPEILNQINIYLRYHSYSIDSILELLEYNIEKLKSPTSFSLEPMFPLMDKYRYYYWLLNPFNLNITETAKIMNPILKNDTINIDLIRTHTMMKNETYFGFSETKYTLDFVLEVFQRIYSIISQQGDIQYARIAYHRLLLFTWDVPNNLNKDIRPELRSTIERLLEIVSEEDRIFYIHHLPQNIYKFGDQFEPLLKQIFTTFANESITDDIIRDIRYESSYLQIYYDKKDIQSLVDFSFKQDDSIIRGFLKWFALTNLIKYGYSETLFVDKMTVELDKKLLIKYLKDRDLFVVMGAIYLLSHSRSISIKNVSDIFDNGKMTGDLEKFAWLYLFVMKVAPSASQQKNKVLLRILSSNSYSKILKKLARQYLESPTKTLYDQQEELGLPFN